MNKATLGGLSGAGEVHSRRASETRREYRGAFAFRAEDTPVIARLMDSGQIVEYVGQIDQGHNALQVLVTDVSLDRGIAYFMGKGDPYRLNESRASGSDRGADAGLRGPQLAV
jgi:hypothetical protein